MEMMLEGSNSAEASPPRGGGAGIHLLSFGGWCRGWGVDFNFSFFRLVFLFFEVDCLFMAWTFITERLPGKGLHSFTLSIWKSIDYHRRHNFYLWPWKNSRQGFVQVHFALCIIVMAFHSSGLDHCPPPQSL